MPSCDHAFEEFPFDDQVQAPFRVQPGLQRLRAGEATFSLLKPGSRHQREKMAVLSGMPQEAMQRVGGFDETKALDAACWLLAKDHPDAFTWDGERLTAAHVGVSWSHQHGVQVHAGGAFGLGDEIPRCLKALDPTWQRAGLLSLSIAEDLAIVDGTTGKVPWMCVALPSRWSPREKVGGHFAEIHQAVADNKVLMAAAEHLMRLVCKPDALRRYVWSVTDHPRLNAHPIATGHAPWLAAAFQTQRTGTYAATPTQAHGEPRSQEGPAAWFRHERQTFMPVPAIGQAVFAIRVDVQPMHRVVRNAWHARRLHDAIASMGEDVLRYRRLHLVRDDLLAWLDNHAKH
jgi:dimethylamine monooxygenase subunit A